MYHSILAIMLSLARYEPQERIQQQADAIVYATTDAHEVAVLTAISFYETTFGRSGVPFGACAHLCRHRCGVCRSNGLRETAQWALSIVRVARRNCGPRLQTQLGYYHSGVCRADNYSIREARYAHRIEVRLQPQVAGN